MNSETFEATNSKDSSGTTENGACDNSCWIWPSITQRAYQAAEIIVSVNKVDRSHIVPEYRFLDARGLGAYKGEALESVSEQKKFSNAAKEQRDTGHY